jgi:hypothetical protein
VDLPELSKKDVEVALTGVLGRDRQGRRLFAFHGRYAPGTREEISIEGGERFHVVPVRSELDLRAQMPPLGSASPPMAFIVPWTGEIPIDLAGRFSRDGRIKRIGKDSRLKRLLGATELAENVLGSALAEHLLTHPADLEKSPPLGGRVTLDALFDRWLKARFGIDTTDGLALDLLLGWAAVDTRVAEYEAIEASHPALTTAIEDHLQRTLRDAGVVVWKAWRERRGRALLELAVLFEALAGHDSGPAFTWRGMQQPELGVKDDGAARQVALQLGDAVGRALRWVDERQPGLARTVLASAEAKVTASDVRSLLAASKRLPVAWELRLAALGAALEDGAAQPSPKAFERAVAARAQLETHAFFFDAKQEAVTRRAERAVQLLAWLSSGQTGPEPADDTPYRDAEGLGRWYAQEGGFVDLARRDARGPHADAFGRGVQAIVRAADTLRASQDRRFARSLAGWIDAGRPSSQALPIDMALERIAVRFLEGEPTRKLLVLLMDGMAWAQAVSILDSLGDWAVPWGPVAWHATAQGRIGQSTSPVVFAQVPTVTEVSRAAFFASKPTAAGVTNITADDPKRWLGNKAVAKIEGENVVPRLLLRGEGHTTSGVASQEALSLVGDPSRRMVAIVINAIDASLKGDTQQRHEWTADSIGSLTELLDKARESGRAVLLAADHGHVPGDLLVSKGTFTGGGPRWRPWEAEGDAVGDGEVGFHGTGVWAPKGKHGVVLLADDTSRYGGGAHAGEHGGASLAEVVVPCLLIAPDDGRDLLDAHQKVMPLAVPSWWHLEVDPILEVRAQGEDVLVPPRRPAKKSKSAPEEQLALGALATAPLVPNSVPAAEVAAQPRRISSTALAAVSPLAQSDLFISRSTNAHERKRALAAVQYLRERGDAAHLDAFCAALGEPAWRASGLIRALQTILNVDGYESLTHDLKAKQVRLQRAVLEAQFGVKL